MPKQSTPTHRAMVRKNPSSHKAILKNSVKEIILLAHVPTKKVVALLKQAPDEFLAALDLLMAWGEELFSEVGEPEAAKACADYIADPRLKEGRHHLAKHHHVVRALAGTLGNMANDYADSPESDQVGGDFWGDFADGALSVLKPAAKIGLMGGLTALGMTNPLAGAVAGAAIQSSPGLMGLLD